MIHLHYFPGNASMAPHALLEEIGVPYELAYVDRAVAAHKSPAYLRLNPNGLIPVLVDDAPPAGGSPLVLFETAAVCLHLADAHPRPGWPRRSFYDGSGGDVWTTTPEELARFQAAEADKWGRMIKAAGIEAE